MATAMRALIVVMLTVLAENGGQMAFGGTRLRRSTDRTVVAETM
jgi:hypothetical protein